MTTATKLTVLRIVLIPAFMALVLTGHNWFALTVFIVACLTDLLDGIIARKYKQTTDLGKFLDPLADKLLVLSAMVLFIETGRFPAWAVMVVLAREFAVSGLRMVAATKGHVIAAGWSGKIKTASTMVGLCAMIAFSDPVFAVLDTVVMWVIVATTVVSGVEYFWKNGRALT